ncbi:MAG: hypothetical protein ACYC56_06100 [Candidatus Aquicultor sp.]
MSERKTVLKVLGIVAVIGLLLILVAGCGGNAATESKPDQQVNVQQNSTQQTVVKGPRVLLFSATW